MEKTSSCFGVSEPSSPRRKRQAGGARASQQLLVQQGATGRLHGQSLAGLHVGQLLACITGKHIHGLVNEPVPKILSEVE